MLQSTLFLARDTMSSAPLFPSSFLRRCKHTSSSFSIQKQKQPFFVGSSSAFTHIGRRWISSWRSPNDNNIFTSSGGMTLNYEVVVAGGNNNNNNKYNKISNDSKNDIDGGGGADGGSILFLHGVLGKGNEFKTLATKVCQQQQKSTKGYLFDLRGHGKSRLVRSSSSSSSSDSTINPVTPMTFDDCILDIKNTITTISAGEKKEEKESNDHHHHHQQQQQYYCYPHTVVGHSWGGRLALQYAATVTHIDDDYYNPNLQHVWLLDTVPGQINKAVEHGLLVLVDLMTNNNDNDSNNKRFFKGQNELIVELQSKGVDLGIAQWLTSSYKVTSIDEGCDDIAGCGEGGEFDFDLDVVRDVLKDFHNQDFYGLLETAFNNNNKLRIDLVKAGKNTGWTTDPQTWKDLIDFQKKHSNQFFVHELPNAGHWVHDDDLDGLVHILSK